MTGRPLKVPRGQGEEDGRVSDDTSLQSIGRLGCDHDPGGGGAVAAEESWDPLSSAILRPCLERRGRVAWDGQLCFKAYWCEELPQRNMVP